MYPNKGEHRKEKYGLTNWHMKPTGNGDDVIVYLFYLLLISLYILSVWLITSASGGFWVGLALLAGAIFFTYLVIYGDDD